MFQVVNLRFAAVLEFKCRDHIDLKRPQSQACRSSQLLKCTTTLEQRRHVFENLSDMTLLLEGLIKQTTGSKRADVRPHDFPTYNA